MPKVNAKFEFIKMLDSFRDDRYTPTKRSNAQHLIEYEKQLLYQKKKIRESHAIAYGFIRLWYKYELRKYSHWSYLLFAWQTRSCLILVHQFYLKIKSDKTRELSDIKFSGPQT